MEFFARLDSLLDQTPACTADWLLANIPVREMRQHLQVMQFLEAHLGIALTPEAKRNAVDRERIDELLRRARSRPYFGVLNAFSEVLVRRGCGLLTRRQYLAVAAAFCDAGKVGNEGWEASALSAFLDASPGQRTNLGVFVRFCQIEQGWDVAALSQVVPATNESRSAQRFRLALKRIESCGDAVTQAMLAGAIAQAFSMRPGSLRGAEIVTRGSACYLEVDGTRHRIPRPMHAIALRWQALAVKREME